MRGEAEIIVLLIFVLWQYFYCWWVRVVVCGRKSYLGAAEIASFFSRDFSRVNEHNTFWHTVSTGYFYVLFLWVFVVSDFCLLETYKNIGYPMSTITLIYSIQSFLIQIHNIKIPLLFLLTKTIVYKKKKKKKNSLQKKLVFL